MRKALLVVVGGVLIATITITGVQPASAATCVINGTPVTTVASQPECDALVALYASTDGTNWDDNTGWNTPTDPCGWHGVTCDWQNVTQLNLYRNSLSGPIPAAFGGLTNVTYLYLAENELTSLPGEFGNLSSLIAGYLDDNQFTSLPSGIVNLTNTHTLSFSNNQLASLPPEIGYLTNLDSLGLSWNRLTTLPVEIGGLANLTHLYLTGNQLPFIPAGVGFLSSLTHLYASHNLLSGNVTASMLQLQDTINYLQFSDGAGGNNCLTTTSSSLATWMTSLDANWNECEAVLAGASSVITYDLASGAVFVVDVNATGDGFTTPTVSGTIADADTVGTAYLGGPGTSGDDVLFYSSATGRFQFASVSTPDSSGHRDLNVFVDVNGTQGWTHVITGNFDGPCTPADVLFYRASDGLMRFYTTSSSGVFTPLTDVYWGTRGWTHLVVGDYNNDGSDDVMWYRATDGLMRFYEVTSTGTFQALTPAYFGTRNWTTIPAGDYDGNGTDDVLFYRSESLARFYEVDATGTFHALGTAFTPGSGYTQIEAAEFTPATPGVDLAWYHAGTDQLRATSYDTNGVTNLWSPQTTSGYGDHLTISTGVFP